MSLMCQGLAEVNRNLSGYSFIQTDINKMSHVMRKPIFTLCEQQKCRSACASAQSDQHLCCSLPGRKIRRRNKTHAKAKKTDSEKLISKFETLRREIKDDVRKQHDLYVDNLVGDVKANPRVFYRYINSQKKR